jgi:hypothetical protein
MLVVKLGTGMHGKEVVEEVMYCARFSIRFAHSRMSFDPHSCSRETLACMHAITNVMLLGSPFAVTGWHCKLRVTDGIPLWCPLLLPVGTVNCV